MAVLTELGLADASRVAQAHGLPPVRAIVPIAAGSVNSNFFLDLEDGRRVFMRIYEEQETDGVAFEWAILRHLQGRAPIPERLGAVTPGQVRVSGKPVALFALAAGTMSCQAGVTAGRARAVGELLATVHRVGTDLGWRRKSRFDRRALAVRMGRIPRHGELGPICNRLEFSFAELDLPAELPRGLTHGDLFRDNVLWEDETLSAAIDWESAAWDVLAYDLAVALLAWCVGDDLDWDLARAMVAGYESVRPLSDLESGALRDLCRAAALRFTVTRITDFHLRSEDAVGVHKDYRRFLMRLDRVEAFEPAAFVDRLRSC
ncbi:MAG: homoserine kinase [Sandaracinus sp.]|nr:homoserine kinase [Sandaracinus sp.]